MAVDESQLLSLPADERIRLAEMLMESTVPADIGAMLREFTAGLERTNQRLDETLERLRTFDERLERGRAEVREAVIRSGEVWPFPLTR